MLFRSHNEETIKNKKFHQRMESVKTILLVLLIFGVGILCEIYINPEIMRKMTLFF